MIPSNSSWQALDGLATIIAYPEGYQDSFIDRMADDAGDDIQAALEFVNECEVFIQKLKKRLNNG